MTCKPRPISGNLPFDAIAKDYNRYCDRIVGNTIPGGSDVINIFNDSNIPRTFSQPTQSATVTNTSPAADGTGSFELHNNTQAAWVNGVLTPSGDDLQWSFNPTNNFTVGDSLVLHLKNTILTIPNQVTHGGNDYTCILDNIAVEPGVTAGWATYWQDDGAGSSHDAWSGIINYSAASEYEGPFTVEYKVVNRLPTMDTLTVDATSVDANIGIVGVTGTDLDGQTLTFGMSLTDDSSTVALYQDEAAWILSGFDTGLPEGTDTGVEVFCFAKDTSGGISIVSISDTCAVDIPDVTPPLAVSIVVDTGLVVSNPISITSMLGTDAVGLHATPYIVSLSATPPLAGSGLWATEATWIGSGIDSGLTEGQSNPVLPIYLHVKDAADNVSTVPASTTANVAITHTPAYSEQPTIADTLYDGCTLTVTATDASHTIDFDLSQDNESSWDVGVKTGIASAAQQTITADGMAAGTIANLIKTRIYDTPPTGTTDQLVSSFLASFDTAKPVIDSVVAGDGTLTVNWSDPAGAVAGDTYTVRWGETSESLDNSKTGETGTNYIIPGLVNGTPYFTDVIAVVGGLNSTPSTEDSGTPTVDTGWGSLAPYDYLALELNDSSTLRTAPGGGTSPLDGEDIGEAIDQSPDGFDVIQAIVAFKPHWQSGGAVFSSVAQQFLHSDGEVFLTSGAYTCFTVAKGASQLSGVLVAQHDNTATEGRAFLCASDTSNGSKARTFINNGTSYGLTSTDTAFDNTDHVVITGHDGTSTLRIAIDDGTFDTVATGAWTPQSTSLGVGAIAPDPPISAGNPYNGIIKGLIIYKGELTAGQITAVLAKIDTDILGL